jgi:NAD(P)-dependent dehydrogenase (short-subunit alcohol dehydrogenase family)
LVDTGTDRHVDHIMMERKMTTSDSGARLKGRRILITGAASGIGLATARLFVEQGARVGLLDRNEAATAAIAEELGGSAVAVDVTDQDAVNAGVAAIAAELGGLDGLVNCAGIGNAGRADAADYAGWHQTLAVNLTGPYLITVAALPFLKQAETATIVNVSSGFALCPTATFGAYSASKAGLLAWTKVLAQELAPSIRVNATCPGATDTPMMRLAHGNDTSTWGVGRALGRSSEPLEQAHAILFLTGPESSYITGTTLSVDGGKAYY